MKTWGDILTKEYLHEQFIVQKKGIREIAAELGCSISAVTYYNKKYGLRRPNQRHIGAMKISKEYLEEHYVRQEKGMRQIAKELGIKNKYIVQNRLQKYGIAIHKSGVATEKQRRATSRRRFGGYGEMRGGYWGSILAGASLRQIEVSVSKEYVWDLYIQQERRCAYTGLEIRFPRIGERASAQTASLDRIDSRVGYHKGNLQWVHKTVQRMKSNIAPDEFVTMCKLIAAKAGNSQCS